MIEKDNDHPLTLQDIVDVFQKSPRAEGRISLISDVLKICYNEYNADFIKWMTDKIPHHVSEKNRGKTAEIINAIIDKEQKHYCLSQEKPPYSMWLEYVSTKYNVDSDWLDKAAKLYKYVHVTTYERESDAKKAYTFWFNQFPSFPNDTRNSIIAVLSGRLEPMLASPAKDLFFKKEAIDLDNTFGLDTADNSTDSNKIIVLNIPQKLYGDSGVFAQTLFKQVWQRAAERRGEKGERAFLWADEAQFFVTPKDSSFLQTARSSRIITVFLTQTIPNLRAKLDDSGSTSESDTFLSNCQTIIFHANSCPVTNRYAEELFGTIEVPKQEFSIDHATGRQNSTISYEEKPLYYARIFTSLKSGGRINDCRVEAIVYRRAYRPDQNDIYAIFDQNFR